MVPSQIKISNLAQIILKSKASLKSKLDTVMAIEDMSVQSVYDSLCGDVETS